MVHVAEEFEREQITVPIMIGGATTSARHTAVKIAPKYSGDIVHVLDASRAAGVVEKLINPTLRESFSLLNRADQQQQVDRFKLRQQCGRFAKN